MRLLFVNPSVHQGSRRLGEDAVSGNFINYMGAFQPLGLLYIASSLRGNGFAHVGILDAQALNLTAAQAAARAAADGADVIGISCSTFSFLYVLELARELRRTSSARIVVGGPHVGIYPEEVMSHGCFDLGIVGEGEHAFVALARALMDGGDGLEAIAGLVYRKNGRVVVNRPEVIADLDALALPARDILCGPQYRSNYRTGAFASLLTTRGCPYRCSYCSHVRDYDKVRFVSPGRVVEEMRECADRFGARCFQFFDDTFLLDRERVLEICRLLGRENLGIEYLVSTRVDLLDEELARALSQSGCVCINLGIESGDQSVLDYMEKGITVGQSRRAIELCRRYGMESVAFLMVGVPVETRETVRNTVDFIRQACPNWLKTNIFVPYAGSPVYDRLVRDGKIPDLWREMTLTGLAQEIPEVCGKLTKNELKNICTRLNLLPYFRRRSNFFNITKFRRPQNVIWSVRWVLKQVSGLLSGR